MSMPASSYPAPAPKVRFDVINQAWSMLQQQMGTWVLMIVVYLVVGGVANYVLSRIPAIGGLLGGLPVAILMAGLYKAALKHVRGEAIAVGDMFDLKDVLGPIIVAWVLTTIGTAIGFVLCILPGIVVNALWMFTQLLIVDKGMDGVAAMRESFNTLRGEWLMAALFLFVIFLIAAAGALACGVGILITIPIAILSITILYRDFFPETGSAAPESPFVPPTV
jgi:hypothetical protein